MFADIQTTRQRKSSNNAERNTIVIYFLISDGEIHLVSTVYKSTNNYAGDSLQILMMFSFTFPLSSGFIYQALSDF